MRRAALLALVLVACDGGDPDDAGVDAGDAGPDPGAVCPEPYEPPAEGLPACDVSFDPAIELLHGVQMDGSFIALNGRRAVAAGPSMRLARLPHSIQHHPTLNVAYVMTTDGGHFVNVIDTATMTVVQREEAVDRMFYGMRVSPDGARIYASGGQGGRVFSWDIDPTDGTLTAGATAETGVYLSGLEVSDDGARVWVVGSTADEVVVEIDTATMTETRRIDIGHEGWDLLHLPGRDELYVSGIHDRAITVIDLAAGAVAAELPIEVSPAELEVNADESIVWSAVSGSDSIVAIDTGTRSIVDTVRVNEDEDTFVDEEGAPLPNSNVNALHFDATRGWLFVSRGADNRVSVYEAATLTPLGDIPSDRYPNDVVLAPDGRTLLVLAWKGGGSDPGAGHNSRQDGSLAFVDLDALDLAAASAEAETNYRRLLELFPTPSCDFFPIPTTPGAETPIEHVVFITKENRTFDSYFGTLDVPGLEADPSEADVTEDIIPNQFQIARDFVIADNFYFLAPESDTGHLFLTATHMSEYAERVYVEHFRGPFLAFSTDPLSGPAEGNLFTHLYDHGVSVRIYGEVVGLNATAADGTRAARFSDSRLPGGPIVNYNETDVAKATYIAEQIERCQLRQFTYINLPNDHAQGTTPGAQTPESYFADNDAGVGIILDALSRSPYWGRSVVFVLEDDTQQGGDHVSAARGFLLTAGPWARRGHVSSVISSYHNVFATIFRIFGVPPLGRPEASVPPLWDHFTTEYDPTPYTARERTFPLEFNPPDGMGVTLSQRLDYSGPDRDPENGEMMDVLGDYRMRRIDALEAYRLIQEIEDRFDFDDVTDESEEERYVYDRALADYAEWYRREHGTELVLPR